MVRKLIDLCKGKDIYIQTHNFPDPDAIASAYGLQKLLEKYDIRSTLCYEGRIDKISTEKMLEEFEIEMYPYDAIRDTMKETDPIICVDSQKNAGNITDFIGDEIACIDHHPTFVHEEYLYKDVVITGACATLITDYYVKMGVKPSENVATALLYGIKMDTQQFSRGVTGLDIKAFDFLFPLHNKAKLTRLEQNTMVYRDLKAFGAAIEHIEVYGSFGYTMIPFACPDSLIATLADFILSLEEVEVVVVMSVREDGLKISVRSEVENVHSGYLVRDALAELGTGGGHVSMAGGMIPSENFPLLGGELSGADAARMENFYGTAVKDRFLRVLEKNGFFRKAEVRE